MKALAESREALAEAEKELAESREAVAAAMEAAAEAMKAAAEFMKAAAVAREKAAARRSFPPFFNTTPEEISRLYLPKIFKSNGPTTDMWAKAKDLEANADIFLEVLSEGVGKPKEEIAKDVRHGKYFNAKETIEYGIADRISTSLADSMDTQKATERKARATMLEAGSAGSSPGAVPTSNHGLL